MQSVRRHAEKVGNVINFDEYKHEWKFDSPWHMVNLKDWFYMVNVGHFGDVFLHVRILGVRSLWTFPDTESRPTKRAPDARKSAPLEALSTPEHSATSQAVSTLPAN